MTLYTPLGLYAMLAPILFSPHEIYTNLARSDYWYVLSLCVCCLRLLNDDAINFHTEKMGMSIKVSDKEMIQIVWKALFPHIPMVASVCVHFCANNCFYIQTKWKFDNSLSVVNAQYIEYDWGARQESIYQWSRFVDHHVQCFSSSLLCFPCFSIHRVC